MRNHREAKGHAGSTGNSRFMALHLAHVALLVHEYDEAIAFYTKSLGFTLIADETLGQNKRWVLVGPTVDSLPSILLARAR